MPGLLTREVSALMLLGDEAVALGAVHAGISGAYAYPGTPSTEILEALIAYSRSVGAPRASWCANEKTAYEEALGMSMAGRRALVAMKHVGLNVAADPFMNSAVVAPKGGLVLAVADDPGMHSSQNEQDSRYYADFARIPCLEPATPQEAYEMTLEAFDISERFRTPVLLRLVTRLAHERAEVRPVEPRLENPTDPIMNRKEWVLLPAFARENWKRRLEQSAEVREWSAGSEWNHLDISPGSSFGVITTGIARNYYFDVVDDVEQKPSHLHVGAYPLPVGRIRELVSSVSEVLVLEEGYPYLERYLRGIIPPAVLIRGRESGDVPPDGELSQDLVRKALGLPSASGIVSRFPVPERPPRLCDGCPHTDAYDALSTALEGFEAPIVTSDIGCYTLGVLPPHSVGDSCVCMGASVGMAKGASEAGVHPCVAVIGDSTFLHSGITPLMDAITADANMTLIILDNDVVAMTGSQPTILPAEKLKDVVLGLGADPNHVCSFELHPRKVAELAELLREEIDHRGLSVVIAHRACIEAVKKIKKSPAINPKGESQ
ncbi:MAG: thiamine pyrophosphate-dependent enzyme [Thermoanaerobaculia bacterium]